MNSHDIARASRLLEEITQLLSEDYLRTTCDELFQKAVNTFQWPESPPANQAAFLDTVGSFVSHIYAHAWQPKQILAPSQGRAEAIRLLKGHYHGQHASGYEAAYLDAQHPTFAGLEFVLDQLSQILANKARKQHLHWVLHEHLSCLPWSLKRQVASELMKRWQIIDPQSLHQSNPSQVADYCAELLIAQINSGNQFSERVSAGREFYGFCNPPHLTAAVDHEGALSLPPNRPSLHLVQSEALEMKKMAATIRSTQEKLNLFRRRFSGLPNTFGTYDPTTGRSWQVKRPVNDKVLLDHLRGRRPYGVYLLTGDRTRAVVVDFDNDDLNQVVDFISRAAHYKLKAHIERSKSKGHHVWIFFGEKRASAAKARLVISNILEEIDAPDTEVFPKQDRLDLSLHYGNFINAPLFGRLVPQGRTVFLNPTSFKPYKDQWAFLDSAETVDESVLDELIEINQWKVKKEQPSRDVPRVSAEPSIDFGLPPCAQKMLLNGVEQYQRVSCFRLAVHFKRVGMPYDMAVAALKVWSLKNRPIDGKGVITEQEIVDQAQYAYNRNYRGCGCESPAVSPHCQEGCPVKATIRRKGFKAVQGGVQ